MYNPKDERSDDFSRINLRHEIVAPNFPDLNLINVFNSSVDNKDAIFQKQSVQDVNTRVKQDHTKRGIHNKSINRALKYLDALSTQSQSQMMIACDKSCSLKLASLLNVYRTIVKFCTSLAWCILTYIYGKYFYGLFYLFISFSLRI